MYDPNKVLYMIRRTSDGLYSSGGVRPKFGKMVKRG